MANDFAAWSRACQADVEAELTRLLPSPALAPRRLHEAMRYAVLGGGKRVRPLLALAGGELTGASLEAILPVACAVELIHAYSLVHDDLPCMDDDALRRGKPTCHVEFDEATALLAGDALQSLAFEVLSREGAISDAATQLALVHILAHATGAGGMAGGQALDLAAQGKTSTLPELEFMHVLKTGALIRASVLMGARCGERLGAAQLEKLEHYAKCVGLAFQVMDDVLDAEADTATLGKTAGKDAAQQKPTYASALGGDAARQHARELRAEAVAALQEFGEKARRLRDLADFIVLRQF
jgi:farnesyl diphosphate synthase